MPTDEIINIDGNEANGRPVVVNCSAGSTVTVNVNVRIHNYYGLPQWMDRDALNEILKTIKGRGNGQK